MVKRVDRLYILLTVIFLVGLSGLFLIQSDNSITGAAVGPIDSIVSTPQENQIIPIQTEPDISSNKSNITFNSSPEEGSPSQTQPNSGEGLSQPILDTDKSSGGLGTTSEGDGGDIHIAAPCGGATPCDCGSTLISSRTLTAADQITNGTCTSNPGLTISSSSITLDCDNRIIKGQDEAGSAGIRSTGRDGIVIQNCRITNYITGILLENGESNTLSGNTLSMKFSINVGSSNNTIIESNRFLNSPDTGITINNSKNNIIQHNNFTNNSKGLVFNSVVFNNTVYNNSFVLNRAYAIYDLSDGLNNTLLYNNSFGYINWTNTNLTTNISILQEGVTVFLEQNITGLATDNQTMELNGTAEIGINNLNYFQTPQLYKDGVRCDTTNSCNITSYSQSTGVLRAIVGSFSNYSSQKNNSPPTITTPQLNASSLTLFSDLKATINYSDLNNDTSNVTFRWYVGGINVYNFTNSSVINGTNISSILTQGNLTMFAQVNVSVYANDSVNVSQTLWSTNLSVDDDIIPNVTFVNPANGTNVSVNFQIFNATIVEHGPDTVYFMFNTNTTPFNVTATNTSNNWNASVNVTTIVEGVHIVTVFANDTSGNVNNSETITITVDRTVPSVSWIVPANNTNYSISSSNQSFNATVTDTLTNINTILFMFDNGSGTDFNVTGVNISGSWSVNYNVSTLAEGSQTITVYANDTLGNTNLTEQITITTDYTAPSVTITNPINGANVSTNFQAFNTTVTDALTNINTVIFQFATNTTPFNVTATNSSGDWNANVNVTNIVEGAHVMLVLANDTLNNINQTESVSFTVDRTVPTVTWQTPTNNSNYSISSGNQLFNTTITDALTDINTVLFMFDNGSGMDFNVTATNNSGNWNITYNVSTLAEGVQTVTVFANDTLGNTNQTEQITITTDYSAPIVSIAYPGNDSRYNTTTLDLNFSVTDTLIDTCWYTIDAGVTNTTLASCANTTFTPGRGNFNITVYANDSFNLLGFANGNFSINQLPVTSNIVVNTTDVTTNDTNQNVIVYFDASDTNNDVIKNITNWYVNGTSISILNIPFEKINGTTINNTQDYSGQANSAIENNVIWKTTGGYDGYGAYEFDGSTSHIDYTLSLVDSIDMTFMCWISPALMPITAFTKQSIFSHISTPGGPPDQLVFQLKNGGSGTDLSFSTNVSSGIALAYNVSNWTSGDWHHIAGTFDINIGETELYIDGNQVDSGSAAITLGTNAANMTIGGEDGLNSMFNGSIDDCIIFNRSLTEQQILALYNNRTDLIVSQETAVGDNWSACVTSNDGNEDGARVCSNNVTINVAPDTTFPLVTITNPANNTNVSINLQAFNVTVVEDNIDTVLFMYTTNTTPFNVSPTNVSNNWSANVNISGIEEGVHIMTVFANDTSGNINNTETVTFTVDRTAPTVNMINSSFNTTDTTPSFSFNYTDLSISANCSLYINNSLNTTNNSVLNGTNTIITSSILSSPADYFVSINCTDGSGNTGASSSINITVNTNTAPNTTDILFNSSTINNYSTDTLTLWVTGLDDEQTNLTAYWIIYQNATMYSNGSTNITNGTLTNIINVSSDNTTIGDNWTGSVLMSDGIINETEWNNNSITIRSVGCGPVTGDIVFDGNLAVSGPCFSIGTSGITIDGKGNSITGDGTGNGLALVNASNVTVTNLTISNFSTGFFADPAIGLIIDSINITDSTVGLDLYQINQSTVSNSNFERNNLALNINDSHFNIFQKNTLTGNGSGKGIYLQNANNATITNHTINNFSVGVYADPAVGIIFENNTVANSTNTGLVFDQINLSSVKNNLFQQNALGINLTNSYFNTLTNNLFNDTLNVIDTKNNTWNATYNCSISNWTNIIGGSCQGGNFWSNYSGVDDGSGAIPHNNGTDGIGDTLIPYNGTTGIYNITNGGDYLPLTSPGVPASSSPSSSGGGGSSSSSGGSSAISAPGTSTTDAPSATDPTQTYQSNQEITQHINVDLTQVQGSKGFQQGSKASGVLGAGTRLSIKLVNTGDKTLEFTPKVTSDVEIEKTNPFFIVKRKVYSPLEDKGTGITLSSKPVLGTLFLPKVTFEGVEISSEGKILVPPGEVELIVDIASPFSPQKEVSAKVEFLSFDEPFYKQDVTYSQDLVSLTGVDVNTDQKAIDMYLALASAKDIIQEEKITKEENVLTGNLIFNSRSSQTQRYFLEVSLRKNANHYENIVIPSKFGFGKSILRNADGSEPFAELYGPYDLDKGEDFVFAQQFDYDPEIYNEEYTMQTRIVRDGNIITDDSFDLQFNKNALQSQDDESFIESTNMITGAIVGTIKNSFIDGFVIVMFLAVLGLFFVFRENIKRNTAKRIVSTRSKFKTQDAESDLEKDMRESYEETSEWLK
jgi:parallel beta-helix repeat protein